MKPEAQARTVLAEVKRLGSPRIVEQMSAQFGIRTRMAYGLPMGTIQKMAKELGKSHELALALWETGCHEVRCIAAYVDEPERVTSTQMDRWCRDFDNWGICDTVCFVLFDRTPHAFGKIGQWSGKREEFVKRGAFALLASVALHDKKAPDKAFLRCLPLCEQGAADGRNFVKKGVVWALRAIAKRNAELHRAALEVAERLAASEDAAERWVGKTTVRELRKRG